MSNNATAQNWLNSLSANERLLLAKEKTSKLVDHVTYLIALNESNKLLCSSDLISKQIGLSRAAHTFNMLQHSQYAWELTRLCALWDKVSKNRESIPTIIALIDHPDVKNICEVETSSQWGDEPLQPDAELDEVTYQTSNVSWKESERAIGQKQGKLTRRRLNDAISISKKIEVSDRLKALQSIRNNHLAHNLDGQTATQNVTSSPLKYGDNNLLLKEAQRVADRLHCGLNLSSFDYKGSRGIAKRNAAKFWKGVSVNVLG